MNATEGLLRQSLKALDREVEVTEDDLNHARHRFTHRRAQQQRRRRSVTSLAVAAAAATAAVVGSAVLQALDSPEVAPATASNDDQPAEPTQGASSVSASDLVGLWAVNDGYGWLWEFAADGTVSIDNAFSTRADVATSDVGSSGFSVHGGLLDVHGNCAWRVTMESDGRLTGVLQGPDGTPRDCGQWPDGELGYGDIPGDEPPWEWVRVSYPPAQGLSSVDATTAPIPLELSPSGVSGVWWQEDGDVLFISRAHDGQLAYRLDNDGDLMRSPDDIGAATLDRAAGTLTLATDPLISRLGDESHTCRPGSQATMTGLSLTIHKSTSGTILHTLTVDASTGTCEAHDGLDGVWVKTF